MISLSEISYIIYDAVVYIAVAFAIFLIGKFVYQLLHPSFKVKEELVKKDNFAFAIAHVGYYVGLLLAIGSAIVGPSNGLVNDIIDIAVYGLLAIVLLNCSIFLSDYLMLRNFSIRKEIIEDQNAGTGIIEGAVSVASGLIIFGAVSGESGDMLFGILTAVVFWAFGQLALILTTRFYNWITPYNIHEHIEKDNVAVGIGFAGAIIAIGNLIRFGLVGDFEGWLPSFTETGFELVVGLILLPVMRLITDKILLPGEKLTDEIINQERPNVGAALVEAFAYIGGSVLITWCL
ncbi:MULTISPECIES: DUF350 domain-containing protein [Marinifilum]|uniref:Uncharacterized membrane protein YjfL (UPF0719 family) n=1 Tax=Marinifilum flexuosum TaxID=1117708 RepID=A0A419WXE1_9BACT|nr:MULTISPECIES: DUF350 domain-containing protein [Marinifilum]MCY1635412.1 DUF350 domain-containing protein [Marinifilum sp. D737]RKE00163.1 uncharacterized membrane protein YjfL (UPF0719 family) [Marinifilum flexuosum]